MRLYAVKCSVVFLWLALALEWVLSAQQKGPAGIQSMRKSSLLMGLPSVILLFCSTDTDFWDPQRERCYSWCCVCSHPLLMAPLVWFLWLYRCDKIKIGRDHSRLCNLHPKNIRRFLCYNNPQEFTAHMQILAGSEEVPLSRFLWGQSRHDFALNFRRAWVLTG